MYLLKCILKTLLQEDTYLTNIQQHRSTQILQIHQQASPIHYTCLPPLHPMASIGPRTVTHCAVFINASNNFTLINSYLSSTVQVLICKQLSPAKQMNHTFGIDKKTTTQYSKVQINSSSCSDERQRACKQG